MNIPDRFSPVRHRWTGRLRLSRRSHHRSGTHVYPITAAVAAGLLALILLFSLLHHPAPPPTPPPVAASHPAHHADTFPAATRPTTSPTTRAVRRELVRRDPGGRTTTRPSTTRPSTTRPSATRPSTIRPSTTRPSTTRPVAATMPVSKPARRMTWQEYVLPDMKKPLAGAPQVDNIFQHRSGAAAAKASRRYVQLDGTYRLGALPAHGRMIRLGLWQGQSCRLELWSGREGVRIEIDLRSMGIRAHCLTRPDGASPPTVTQSVDDKGAWRWYGCGAIDLRYQAGHLLICRGEMPLLRVPLARPPTEGEFTAARVRLWLAQVRDCNPLLLPVKRTDTPPATRTRAAKLDWGQPTSDKAKLSVGRDGAVSLSCEDLRTEARAGFVLEADPLTGVEADVHVRGAAGSAGLFVDVGKTNRPLLVFSHEGKPVVARVARRQKPGDSQAGRAAGEDFWVRVRFGLGVAGMWVSPDGRTWGPKRHQPPPAPAGKLHVGLYLARDKAPRRVAIDEVRIRRFTAIRDMVRPQPKLVARAASALTDEILQAADREQAMAMLSEAGGREADPAAWLTACDVVLASRSHLRPVRQAALRELFLGAASRGPDVDVAAVLAALDELGRAHPSLLPAAMHQEVFDALGRSCLRAGRPEALKALLDASYVRPASAAAPPPSAAVQVGAPGLLRTALLDGIARKKWASVRLEALRAMYLGHSRYGRVSSPLARWAAAEAEARLVEPAGPEAPGEPAAGLRELVIRGEGKVMNTLAEFFALVQRGHLEAACKALTRAPLPDVLAALGGEGDLLQSSHARVREVLRTRPRMRAILTKRYSEVGMIRLGRARRRDDLPALRSLSAQFYGTPPGYGAMHTLADRDLSGGDFRGAAAGYQVLQAAEDYPRRRDAAVKFRLVSAMLGRLAGKPVTGGEALPEGTRSAEEFEVMIRRLASARRSTPITAATGPAGPGPVAAKARLTVLADAGGKKAPPHRAGGLTAAALAVDGERLFVSDAGTLLAVDWKLRKVLWSLDAQAKTRGHPRHLPASDTARPLPIGARVYVRENRQGRPLGCFEAKTGKCLWSRQYDDLVVSDPILTGSWLSVIAAAGGVSGTLHLHRVSPDTGGSASSSELVQLGHETPVIGRPVVVGDMMLFRTAGCLICCGRRGAVRWARRLPLVPATVLPELHTAAARGDMIVWRDRHVIFSAPGCPYITCVSADSGQVLWSVLVHSAARLIGLAGDSVILAESDTIAALDPAAGTIRWQRRCETADVGILPAAGDTLLLVRLEKQRSHRKDTPPQGRYVRWLAARDGRTVKELPIESDVEIHTVSQLSGDGKRLFGVADLAARKSGPCKVFLIELVGGK